MSTAAPVSLSRAGRKTVRVGLLTFVTRLTPLVPGFGSVTCSGPTFPVSPGTWPGHTSSVGGLSDARPAAARPVTRINTRLAFHQLMGESPCRLVSSGHLTGPAAVRERVRARNGQGGAPIPSFLLPGGDGILLRCRRGNGG